MITAPDATGTYYYGACVSHAADANPGNDCSSSVVVVVSARRPDLSVSALSVNGTTMLPAGQDLDLSVTVTNGGTDNAASSTVKYYRSADATLTPAGDTQVGTDTVSTLPIAATFNSSSSITVPASLAPGTYRYYACVDTVTGETDTSNNCSAGTSVVVGASLAPDLNLRSASAVPNTMLPGASFDFSITVQNTGTANADSSTIITYYRSNDAAITSTDTSVGLGNLPAIAHGSSLPQSTVIIAPDTEGTYYYGACVSNAADANPSNDCSAGIEVTVATPDLVVQSFGVTPDVVGTGEEYSLSLWW